MAHYVHLWLMEPDAERAKKKKKKSPFFDWQTAGEDWREGQGASD